MIGMNHIIFQKMLLTSSNKRSKDDTLSLIRILKHRDTTTKGKFRSSTVDNYFLRTIKKLRK